MIETANYRMANRLAKGHLAERIIALRADKRSFESIASQLRVEYGIEVTRTTVATWLDALAAEGAA